jgi:hypothetical protein
MRSKRGHPSHEEISQLGEKNAAPEWHKRAVEWMEKNKPQDEELQRFRAEAAELMKIDEKKSISKPEESKQKSGR